MEPTIRAEGLTKRFGRFTAVDNVNFSISKGEIFGFLGPNGSGKSTVIRMLCGLLTPTEGDAWLLGMNICSDAPAIKRRIGYMSQQFSLYRDLTVRENMFFFGQLYGLPRSRIEERTQILSDYLGLNPYKNRQAGLLSGGWRQRLALASALMHEPDIVFLDEPTAGIDPVARRELWNLLFDLSARGITLFVTTHYMDEAERCTLVAYIYLSKLIAFGDPSSLKNLPDVTPKGYRRLELSAQPLTQLLDHYRRHPSVRSATIFGEAAHLLVKQDWPNDEIRRYGTDHGWEDLLLREIPPTLEDVFVSLTLAEEKKRLP
ncbi:MAG: ABC transporter ATP-binding protein [Candidatus Omnitrophica bacterium]|nr:ABC transporter ATP-binding protein [Candidatus Omnitrophota bacterium]